MLVILGLLTGGILGGQSLIRAAELRAVTTEYNRYVAAVNTFKDKYFAIPGDMTNATQFWGYTGGTGCTSTSTSTTSATGTCDGNGDGLIYWGGAASQSGEVFQFWNQLALAGLIEGKYTGIAGPGTSWTARDTIFGTNAPKSKLSNAGWGAGYWDHPGDAWGGSYKYNAGNSLYIGAMNPLGNINSLPVLKPEEAWNIDTKMDDGKPASGKIILFANSISFGTIGSCTTSTSNIDYTGSYNLSASGVVCSLLFSKPF